MMRVLVCVCLQTLALPVLADERFVCAGHLSPDLLAPASRPVSLAQGTVQGRRNAIVVFAKFKGESPGRTTPPDWAGDLLDPARPGSVSHFYETMSASRLNLRGEVAPRVYEASQPASAYLAPSPVERGNFGDFAREVLEQVDEDVDFTRFDNDGPDGISASPDDDGVVDVVFLVLESTPLNFLYGAATGIAELGFAAFTPDDVSPSGRHVQVHSVQAAIQQGRAFSEAAGSICHEYGHVLGLPDLYNREFTGREGGNPRDDSAGIGAWGLMGWGALGWSGDDGPNSLSAWSRLSLGWAEALTVMQNRDVIRLEAVGGGGKLSRIRFPGGEYFLLENRQHEIGHYDRHIPADGLLVWHVRPAHVTPTVDLVCADGQWQDAGFPLGVHPDPDDGGDNLDFWAHDAAYARQHGGNLGDATDVFDGVRYRSLTPETNPNSCSDDGNCSARIEDIHFEEGVAVATVIAPQMVKFEQIWVDDASGDGVLVCGEAARVELELSVDSRQRNRLRVWLSEQDPWIETSGHTILSHGRLREGRLYRSSGTMTPMILAERGCEGTHTASVWLMVEEEIGTGWEMLGRRRLEVEVVDPFPAVSAVEVQDAGGDGVAQSGEFIRLLIRVPERLRHVRGHLRCLDGGVRSMTSSTLSFRGPEGAELESSETPEFLLTSAVRAGDELVFTLELGTRMDTLRILVGEGTDHTPPRVLGLQHHAVAEGLALRMPSDRIIDGSEIASVSAWGYAAADTSQISRVKLARGLHGYEGLWSTGIDGQYLVQAVAADEWGNMGQGPLQTVAPPWTPEVSAIQGSAGCIEGRETVASLAYSADGSLLAVAAGSTVKLFDALRHSLVAELSNSGARVEAIAFHPQEQQLAVGHGDGVVDLWDVASHDRYRIASGGPSVAALAFSPNGEQLACGDREGVVRSWEVISRQEIGRAEIPGGLSISSLVYNPNGRTLAIGTLGGGALMWLAGGREAPAALSEHGEQVEALAFGPSGSYLAIASRDGSVRLWDPLLKRLLGDLQAHGDWVTCLALRPNGQVLASGGWDGTVRLWRMPGYATADVLEVRQGRVVVCLAFSPDGLTLAAGTSSGEVVLWRVPSPGPTGGRDTPAPPVALHAPYPNPFNKGVWIPFSLAWDASIRVRIYGLTGQLIRTLDVGPRSAGHYWSAGDAVYWDGTDQQGTPMASAVYFCAVGTHESKSVQRVMLLR